MELPQLRLLLLVVEGCALGLVAGGAGRGLGVGQRVLCGLDGAGDRTAGTRSPSVGLR